MPRNHPAADQKPILVCTPKRLSPTLWERAARTAIREEPRNAVPFHRLLRIDPKTPITMARLAVVTDRKWASTGVKLTVSFLDKPDAALRKRILSHMNAWNKTANVRFVETKRGGEVRIARVGGKEGGYWSYLGTEILEIGAGKQTMNLEGFTMNTPDSEFHRVVRHETGHTLGFPHEHMRKELIAKIDRQKAIRYFEETQGWSKEEVIYQVLTPLEDSSLTETSHPDPRSIMCYQIPGSLTKNGKPIVGGTDIDALDYAFAGKIYPKPKHALKTRSERKTTTGRRRPRGRKR